MKDKVSKLLYYLMRISIIKFVYYNFISSRVVREKHKFLIIYKHAILDLHKTARIYIYNNSAEIGVGNLKGSKTETHIRMGKNSQWILKNGVALLYNTVIEIQDNAIFETGNFTANGGSVIVCAKKILFEDNVVLGRNIIVYDSDFHQLLDEKGCIKNTPQEVIIEKNVWLTSHVTVLKGVKIGQGSIGAAYTTVRSDIPEFTFFGGKSVAEAINSNVKWIR